MTAEAIRDPSAAHLPSRRELAAAALTVAALSPAAAMGQARRGGGTAPVTQRSGFAAGSDILFRDVLEPVGGPTRPPVVMIHGGGHTASCYLETADGRPGWAYRLAALGHRVYTPDWPGCGRSGAVALDRLNGERVVAELGKLVAAIGEPVVLISHSMGGAFGWKLLETQGQHVRLLVAVAPAPPGNLQPPATVLARGPDYVEVQQPSVPIRLSTTTSFLPPAAFVDRKLIGDGDQFPQDRRARYHAALQAIPPQLILERTNVDGRQLKVADFARYRGKPVVVTVGTNDIDHPETEGHGIEAWLRSNGVNARFVPLREEGITGNGHMMMMERNSDVIADRIAGWIASGGIAR